MFTHFYRSGIQETARIIFVLLFVTLCPNWTCSAQSKPNVLLIMVDDMGYGDLRSGGNSDINTPNLDRLFSESTSFTNFYVSPVCAPTRASLLTGRYHQRTGVRSVTNGYETINPEEVTMAEVFSQHEYRTGLFGKWHLGENYPSLPNAQGFQEYIGFRTGHTDKYFDAILEHNGKPYQTKGYISDALTDEAIKFMNEGKQPFLCYLPYNAPHTPLDVPAKYLKKYLGKELKERVARIYAMMENLDWNIGRLLDNLTHKNLEKNTIVVFMSDNGPIGSFMGPPETWRYNAGLRDQKFTIYEGGIRSRFFLRWTDVFEPKQIKNITAHIDVLPTLMDLCKVNGKTLPLDGRSLMPLLGNLPQTQWPERMLFMNYSLQGLDSTDPYPGGMARTERYKMINGVELYDIDKDPGEKENIADKMPGVLATMDTAYRKWMKETLPGDTFRVRPVEAGHKKQKEVIITPHLGRACGSLKFTGFRGLHSEEKRIGVHPNGVDGDWITNFTSGGDTITWHVKVLKKDTYSISANIHSVAAQNARLVACADKQCISMQINNTTETAPGKWEKVDIGEMILLPGVYRLSVSGSKQITTQNELAIGSVILTAK